MNLFFLHFTTIREEILDNGFHRPYKMMIFECNYYNGEVIDSDISGTIGLHWHMSTHLIHHRDKIRIICLLHLWLINIISWLIFDILVS